MNPQMPSGPFDEVNLDDSFVRQLPGDPETQNYTRQVRHSCYSRVQPLQAPRPELVVHSREVAELLGFPDDAWKCDDFLQVFAGNQLIEGMVPYATCYGGHQFGNWAGQLGDGRVINLCEIVHQQRWVVQLKGAGPTPYSRHADGFAVLRSSVREFLCSEAMHHLGVPTTRALSLVTTGEEVMRDMMYDGNARLERGAVVCRVSPSFTRFGSFELPASRRETDLLRQLADYTVRNDFPHLGEPSRDVYASMFEEVVRRTAEMIVHWMRVGFVHGVMNTDNMSILGLTIDYGPYGWLDNYDPGWTPNTTDAGGRRYRFGHQPQIAMWNLSRFADALYPLVEEAEPLQQALDTFPTMYESQWREMMVHKLGLDRFEADTDGELVEELEGILQQVETDMTIFYRQLARIDASPSSTEVTEETLMAPLQDAYYLPEPLTQEFRSRTCVWLRRYIARVQRDGTSNNTRLQRMNKTNPKYVLRNYVAQLAIEKSEQGDHSQVNELLEVLRHPYDEQPDHGVYAEKRPDWARNRPGCSMLSCSS